jgi:hypothetical protein
MTQCRMTVSPMAIAAAGRREESVHATRPCAAAEISLRGRNGGPAHEITGL